MGNAPCHSRFRSVRTKSRSTRARPFWSANRTGRSSGQARRGSISWTRASSAVGPSTPMANPGISSTEGRSLTTPRESISAIDDSHRGRRHSAAHPWPHRQPMDQRRHARGSRRHEQRHEASALSARDRAALRLCRHLRGEVRQHRAPRSDHHELVADEAAASDDLSKRRLRPRRVRSVLGRGSQRRV